MLYEHFMFYTICFIILHIIMFISLNIFDIFIFTKGSGLGGTALWFSNILWKCAEMQVGDNGIIQRATGNLRVENFSCGK